ncbi:putative protein phosphatase 2C 4 [Carex littledalei]|uniref:protein-serine/threonine phosphatase n=1 Tax=Carex littledalei TaxID=544730 RepID=A0A833R7J4_9POAL|nr:putative protein phosphatase 2C 4 [Carex littledalei]
MGNGVTRLAHCLRSPSHRRRHHVSPAALLPSDAYDDSLGHSFCYVRSSAPSGPAPSDYSSAAFRSISGAAVSANASTALSTSLLLPPDPNTAAAVSSSASFESSLSFASVPLQPAPRLPSGPLSGPLPSDRPFMSGPLDRAGFLSGPLNPTSTSSPPSTLRRSRSVVTGRRRNRRRRQVSALIRSLASSLYLTKDKALPDEPLSSGPDDLSISTSGSSIEWAQGRAGEDRVHVVVSEEHGWVFVGIYDGFNGPDATDFLLTHLYPLIHLHLKGILWQEEESEEMKKQPSGKSKSRDGKARHVEVLKALARALRKTEEAYLSIADNMLDKNPELALMGSCVLVMLMKGEDVYLMNVGDSRAVLATKSGRELEGINEDLLNDFSGFLPTLSSVQLTFDHSTCAAEEIIRIRNEHPDDSTAIAKDRVKGSLKVTRAFGAGFLKQPKWNNALLEMFRIDYVGTAPYITCHPSLYHYRVGPKDKFLILSSDGLYQYLTNEEAVTQVEMFLSTSPDGDPAQHLIEELLFRAADKAGMELQELLEIPQGDRRRYYDDVSIIVISLEGRIWRSFV